MGEFAFHKQHREAETGGLNALLLLEWKFEGKKARERPRRTWIEDLLQWTQKKMYHFRHGERNHAKLFNGRWQYCT